MLDVLNFVRGAIAKKDFAPALTHFRIKHKRILGFNGVLAISSPIELDLDVCPKAVPLVKAIQSCKDTIKLNITPAGKLSVSSGKFRAYIECAQVPFPEVYPEGDSFAIPEGFLEILSLLSPIIAEDASRPWARGILFKGPVALVTNNIVLAQYWTGLDFPLPINLPQEAIAELLRLGIPPTRAQVTESSITFHYEGDRWLRTQLYPSDWPNVEAILEAAFTYTPVPEGLWEAVSTIMPFLEKEGRVYFRDGQVSSTLVEGEGASFAAGVTAGGCFNADQLTLLKPLAEAVDFSTYPKPCGFKGPRLRGLIAGMRE